MVLLSGPPVPGPWAITFRNGIGPGVAIVALPIAEKISLFVPTTTVVGWPPTGGNGAPFVTVQPVQFTSIPSGLEGPPDEYSVSHPNITLPGLDVSNISGLRFIT